LVTLQHQSDEVIELRPQADQILVAEL